MSDVARTRARSPWPALAATVMAALLLVALGVWQLQRLAWKNGVLAQIEARSAGAPVPIPPEAAWPGLRPEDYEYRHVTAAGTYLGRDALVYRGAGPNAPAGEGPGFLVVTPLALDDGGIVLVNRGFAPSAQAEAARAKPAGRVAVAGLMRGPEPRNLFTPADQPDKGVWFTRDPASIAAGLGLPGVAPFTIDVDARPERSGWPRPGATQLAIANNHLAYALTWFGLAASLVGVAIVFLVGSRRG